ncbi:hypothetical protein [Flavobacterium sp.]|uniref:hypothetical protein n=1 Tax=Flavobacterium sp. TaxID=239 RepID=UPI002B4B3F30|nr:hypothetical protein [Flavobacterium sp.]HLF52466.1 hypothetical protein [Flavobacterium sp.]
MMKKLLFLVFTSLFFLSNYAQTIPFKIQKSSEFEDEYKKSTIVLTKDDGKGGVLMVRSYKSSGISNTQGFYLEHYDSNLDLKKEFEFDMKHPNSQKFNMVVGICSIGNEVQIIEIYYDLNEKTYICQANIITEDFKTSKKELFRLTKEEVKKIGTFSLEQKFYKRANEMWTNDNSGNLNSESEYIPSESFLNYSKLNFTGYKKYGATKNEGGSDIIMNVNETNTAFAITMDFNGENSEYLKFYLFDNKLNKKIDTEFTRNIKDKNYLFQNIQVAPDGNSVYLLGKTYTEEERKKSEGGKYLFEITKMTSEFQKSQFIDVKENFIGSLKLIFHDNHLICLGFYSDIKDFRFKGISYFKLDSNSLEILQSKYNLFTEQFMIDKYGENKDKALKFLKFKSCFITKNNNLIFNAQEEYITTTQHSNGASGQTFYNYDDIVSAKMNSDGDLVWARNINKRQGKTIDSEPFISYTSIVKDESTYFFINTGEKIKKLKNDRIEFGETRTNKSNLNLIRINPNGDFDYEEILDDENSPVPFMVSKGAIIDESILFLGRKGKKKQLLKVTL